MTAQQYQGTVRPVRPAVRHLLIGCLAVSSAIAALLVRPGGTNAQVSTVPGYTSYAATNGLGINAGEPSIGVNWKSGRVLLQAHTQTLRVTFNDGVSPATAMWEDKSGMPPICTAPTSFDPILFTDHATGRTFESQLIPTPVLSSLTCLTDTDGDSWTPSEGGGIGSGIDHQTLGGGPFTAGLPGPLGAYPDAVYYCSQDVGAAFCSSSRDGGLTFSPAVPIYAATACNGLHGHVKVAPDGTVYVPNKGCGGTVLGRTVQAVAVSTDDGVTWSLRPVPTSSPGISDPSVGIGVSGTVFFGYQSGNGHPHVAVSRDRGQTWTNDQDVGMAFGIQNTVFPAVVAGGRQSCCVRLPGHADGGRLPGCQLPWRVAPVPGAHVRQRNKLDYGGRHAQRPRATQLHLAQRRLQSVPQPAGLHGQRDRPARTGPGGLRRRVHRRMHHVSDWPWSQRPDHRLPHKARHHRPAVRGQGAPGSV